MDVIFPFGFPAPTAFYLVLFVVTASIYAVFMHYVLAGAAVLLMRALQSLGAADENAESGDSERCVCSGIVRDWLPAILGLAITTGIAPLLFLQILYKKEFYTANLLLFHRFMLLLPSLIVAYYALYLLKSKRLNLRGGWALLASALACVCFAYTASAWAENHLLSLDQGAWVEHFASGRWFYRSWELAPRLAFWLSASFPTLAIVLAWQIHWGRRKYVDVARTTAARRLRAIALDGLGATSLAVITWLILLDSKGRSAVFSALGMPYLTLATLGLAIQGLAWWRVRSGADLSVGRLLLISLGAVAEILGTMVVREARRLGAIDISTLYDAHNQAAQVGGLAVFLTFFAINALVIAACVVLVARALEAKHKATQPAG